MLAVAGCGGGGGGGGDQSGTPAKATKTATPTATATPTPTAAGDVAAIKRATLGWAHAFAARDFQRACALTTKRGQRELIKAAQGVAGTCPEAIRLAFRGTSRTQHANFAHLKIKSVKIHGNVADVVTSADGNNGPTIFRKVNGAWLLTSP